MPTDGLRRAFAIGRLPPEATIGSGNRIGFNERANMISRKQSGYQIRIWIKPCQSNLVRNWMLEILWKDTSCVLSACILSETGIKKAFSRSLLVLVHAMKYVKGMRKPARKNKYPKEPVSTAVQKQSKCAN